MGVMMGWREYAKQVQGAGDIRDKRDNSPDPAPNVPTVPSVPHSPPVDPPRAIRKCRAALESLDWDCAPAGLTKSRWRELLRDADWLLEKFGPQALRDGWTVAELFGCWPGKDTWGGIADRLQSSRSLLMTADRAHWRCMTTGEAIQFNRTAYPDLRPFWKILK